MTQWRHYEMIDSLDLAGPQGFKFVWQKLEVWYPVAQRQMREVYYSRAFTQDRMEDLLWPRLVEETWPFIRASVIMEGRDMRNYR